LLLINNTEVSQLAGYGWVDGDLLPRIAAISAPVFDNDNRLVLALTVLGWTAELNISQDSDTVQTLISVADDLSLELGCKPKT